MFLPFFYQLRDQGIPISLRYVLEFYQALEKGLALDLDRLFILMRLIFIKKVEHFDAFEQAFAAYFLGAEGDTIPRFTQQAKVALIAFAAFDKGMLIMNQPPLTFWLIHDH